MNGKPVPDRLTTHTHRLAQLIGYLLIVVVALRRRYDLVGGYTISLVMLILGLFTLLYATQPILSRKIKTYHRYYFVLQSILVIALGLFQEYQDTWSVLFIVLGFQVGTSCARKEALVWYSLFGISTVVTLSLEFGLISGLGRAMAYIVIGVLLISYDIQYAQREDVLAESRILLAELKEAQQKLEEYASKAEELAAMQEREQMIHELYDAVGQKIFAIQLAAEATRLMLEKDPSKATRQIDSLQEQTQITLNQMRQLINQWRPT
jgi:signal transduction histidine kinase